MDASSSPEAEIRGRIAERRRITFAEFMEVALYWPRGGYYSGSNSAAGDDASPFGPSGDYYTSPMAHPTFGALLAIQLYQFWQLLDRPDPFHVVEPGSGNGQLSRDIQAVAAFLPGGFPDCLRYIRLDRGAAGRVSGSPLTEQLVSVGIPLRRLRGCILSNELMDAFQVHQVRVERGELREVYVTLDNSSPSPSGSGKGDAGCPLVEAMGDPSTPALAGRLRELGIELAEGQTAEINLALDGWAAGAAGALEAGYVLTIDYGRTAEELYSAKQRFRGALTTYFQHTQTDAPLRDIGQQDITAQVDFTSLMNAGRRAGLEPLGYTTQAQFLRNLGLDWLRRRVTSTPLPVAQGAANRAGILALTRPGGLGDFKVLAQGKGLPPNTANPPDTGGDSSLWGFSSSPAAHELARSLPPPLLTDSHISLRGGWPQPAVQEFEFTDLLQGPFADT